MKNTRVSDEQLLLAFANLCKVMGVVSKGFDHEGITAPIDGAKHDGTKQWAMKKEKGLGWMVVSGWKGAGSPLARWNGYIKGRWNFMMMLECVTYGVQRIDRS